MIIVWIADYTLAKHNVFVTLL